MKRKRIIVVFSIDIFSRSTIDELLEKLSHVKIYAIAVPVGMQMGLQIFDLDGLSYAHTAKLESLLKQPLK